MAGRGEATAQAWSAGSDWEWEAFYRQQKFESSEREGHREKLMTRHV